MQLRFKFLTLLSFYLLTAGSVFAESKGPETIEKEAWIKNMKQHLPPVLCQKEQYFLRCFSVTAEQCLDYSNVLVDACLNNARLALPEHLTVKQGEYWGKMVGRCTYDLYNKTMQSQKKAGKDCELDLPEPEKPE